MKKIGLYIMMISLCSCGRKNEIVKVLEHKNDNSYWNQKKLLDDGTYSFSTLQWIFYNDGSSQPLSSLDENKKGSPSLLNLESSGKGTWSFNKKDSTFKICDVCVFKIKKIRHDTIFMIGKGYNGDFILVKHK